MDSTIESIILEGGIAGWVAGGKEYVAKMEEFDQSVWSPV
jgi:arsenical-resistance protein 2